MVIVIVIVILVCVVVLSIASASDLLSVASSSEDSKSESSNTYLDNNATSPCFGEVIDAVATAMRFYYGNPSSAHRIGTLAKNELERCRTEIRAAVSASKYNLVFTSGATEANNLAIRAVLSIEKRIVVTTPLEHPSVYETLASMNADVRLMTVSPEGIIDVNHLERMIAEFGDDIAMVAVSMANSEIGAMQDMPAIAALCRAHGGIHCHVDMTQVFGRYEVNLNRIGAHSYTASAHKFHGPKGVGALFYVEWLKLPPCITGGSQEAGMRAGTENVPGVVGMALALKTCLFKLRDGSSERLNAQTQAVRHAIEKIIPGVRFNGPQNKDQRLYQTLSVSLPFPAFELVHEMSEQGVYVGSSGCACSKGKPSRTLAAIGLSKEEMTKTVRISLGFANDERTASRFVRCLRIAMSRSNTGS